MAEILKVLVSHTILLHVYKIGTDRLKMQESDYRYYIPCFEYCIYKKVNFYLRLNSLYTVRYDSLHSMRHVSDPLPHRVIQISEVVKLALAHHT